MQQNPMQAMHFMVFFLAIYVFMITVGLIAVIVPCWFICRKAGFSPWLSFLNLIFPLGGIVLLYVLAFADWRVVPAPNAFWGPYPPPTPYPPIPQVPQTPPQG